MQLTAGDPFPHALLGYRFHAAAPASLIARMATTPKRCRSCRACRSLAVLCRLCLATALSDLFFRMCTKRLHGEGVHCDSDCDVHLSSPGLVAALVWCLGRASRRPQAASTKPSRWRRWIPAGTICYDTVAFRSIAHCNTGGGLSDRRLRPMSGSCCMFKKTEGQALCL